MRASPLLNLLLVVDDFGDLRQVATVRAFRQFVQPELRLRLVSLLLGIFEHEQLFHHALNWLQVRFTSLLRQLELPHHELAECLVEV